MTTIRDECEEHLVRARDDLSRDTLAVIAGRIESGVGPTRVTFEAGAYVKLIDQLDTAEHAARLAHDRAYKADLAWEDEKRRADQAEAQIKAVQDVLDRHDHGTRIPTHRIRRALDQ